jgi:hypothetical protein
VPLKGKSHRRRDHAQVRGLREERERLVERRLDHRPGPQLVASLPGSFGSRLRARDRDAGAADNVRERGFQGRKVERELELLQGARLDPLARQQHGGGLAKDALSASAGTGSIAGRCA